jgi:predicted nucleic acid-binding Zn ribbon protein
MAERKWEKVDISFTDEERKSFRNALIIFAIIEALVLIPVMLYKIFR